MQTGAALRRERDSLGWVELPAAAYWGAQTQRAIENFPISGIPVGHFPRLIVALAQIKQAAARANAATGGLDLALATEIDATCAEIIAGGLADQFPIDVFQGGAGTSTNMNMYEVIANRCLEHMGLRRGDYGPLHPNNHVNLSQSTNVYPTAIRVAILSSLAELRHELAALADAFDERAAAFGGVLKLGRTQLQDAVPMTLGQEFLAFAVTLREDHARLAELGALFCEVNLGGTAIGTGLNASPAYRAAVVPELARITALPLVQAGDLIEACWDTGAFVLFSGMLKRTATKLSKIANDLRLLSSGPRGGFGEINLPPMQPGSSIMPGKVNPVIPEVVNQVCFQVIGADLTITLASEAGQLQLNVMEPVIAFNLMQSMMLMTNALTTFRKHCVRGITANPDTALRHLEASTAVATALTPVIGYDRAAELAKEVLDRGRTIREVLEAAPDLSPELIALTADPSRLT